MFGLFKKKNLNSNITYQVYLNQVSKYRMLIAETAEMLENNKKVVLVYYFDETGNVLSQLINSKFGPENKIIIIKADNIMNIFTQDNFPTLQVLVVEIHPMAGRDQSLFNSVCHEYPNTNMAFYTSTDGPLMKAFGGDKVHNMMITLGMDEKEKVEHPLVNKSIQRAQEKIKAKVTMEKPAFSKQEWMDINVKS